MEWICYWENDGYCGRIRGVSYFFAEKKRMRTINHTIKKVVKFDNITPIPNTAIKLDLTENHQTPRRLTGAVGNDQTSVSTRIPVLNT